MGAPVRALALAGLAAAWIVAPLLRAPTPPSRSARPTSWASSRTLQSASARLALSALRDLSDDQATGKISVESDYFQSLKARFTERAMDVMKRL